MVRFYKSVLFNFWLDLTRIHLCESLIYSILINISIMPCKIDYISFAVSGKFEDSETGLITPVWWLLLLQLTVLVGPQSLCNRSFWWRFYVVTVLFGFFCGRTGFCHRTELDLFLFFSHSYKLIKFNTKINQMFIRTIIHYTWHDIW